MMDPGRQEEIYQEYADMVFRYLYSLCHDAALSEDLMQDTFLKAVMKADSFKNQSSFSTWLCSIARNEYRMHLRKHKENLPLEENAAPAKAAKKPDCDPVLVCLHAMEDPFKEVLYLRLFGNLSFRQIGEICGQSENWARVTFFRARQKLREEMNRYEAKQSNGTS